MEKSCHRIGAKGGNMTFIQQCTFFSFFVDVFFPIISPNNTACVIGFIERSCMLKWRTLKFYLLFSLVANYR